MCGVTVPDVRFTNYLSSLSKSRIAPAPKLLEVASFPNPSNGDVTIKVSNTGSTFIIVNIYNAAGELIRVLGKQQFPAGVNPIIWDRRDASGNAVSNGTYYYQVVTDDKIATKQSVLIK